MDRHGGALTEKALSEHTHMDRHRGALSEKALPEHTHMDRHRGALTKNALPEHTHTWTATGEHLPRKHCQSTHAHGPPQGSTYQECTARAHTHMDRHRGALTEKALPEHTRSWTATGEHLPRMHCQSTHAHGPPQGSTYQECTARAYAHGPPQGSASRKSTVRAYAHGPPQESTYRESTVKACTHGPPRGSTFRESTARAYTHGPPQGSTYRASTARAYTHGPPQGSTYRESKEGMEEMTGPYLAMLSYSSYKGTATSLEFEGTCNVSKQSAALETTHSQDN